MIKKNSPQSLPHRSERGHAILVNCFLGVAGVLLVLGLYKVQARVSALNLELDSHHWSIPSKIYADSPVLYKGMPATKEWLITYLERLNYVKTNVARMPGQYSIQTDGVLFVKRFSSHDDEQSPVLVSFAKNGIARVVNFATKRDFETYTLEPIQITTLYGAEYQSRSLIKYEDIPAHLIQAVISIEDRRFYQHDGVDIRGMGRALCEDIMGRGRLQGGSTITQQLVKNFYLTSEKSLSRKFKEAVMAFLLERKLNKNQILELYLNEVYLGQRGAVSIHGISEASQFYFHKDVRNVNVPEAALLAGLIQAPRRYSPYQYPENAKGRRDVVLAAMKRAGSITEQQYNEYVKTPVVVQPFYKTVRSASYYVDLVARQLQGQYTSAGLHKGDYRIFTTLDVDLQKAAEDSIAAGLARIDKIRMKTTSKKAQACLIAIDPKTGFVRAFVGGRSYSGSQFDRLTQAVRQPGSSFKPFVYAAAIESDLDGSNSYSPATLIGDEPWSLQMSNAVWQPRNYDGQYHGVVTLRQALAHSMNIATAKLAEKVGLDRIVSLSKSLGFENVEPYPSVALGAFEVSPWQLIQAYTALANGGIMVGLSTVKEVTDAGGTTLSLSSIHSKRVLDSRTAYLVTNMLKTVMISGTAASSHRLGLPAGLAGKTGTTNDFKDAWFVGYTPNLICLVWTGYDDNTPIKMNGAQAALPIWADFMKKALRRYPVKDFVAPAGIVTRLIDPTTGKLASPTCTQVVEEMFLEGTEPTEACDDYYHSLPPEYFDGEMEAPVTTANMEEAIPGDIQTSTENQARYFAPKAKQAGFVYTNENISQAAIKHN